MLHQLVHGVRMQSATLVVLLCAGISQALLISKTGCNKSKMCFSKPASCTSSKDCQYFLTYQANSEDVRFELSAKNQWVAVGFNDVPQMPGVDALICKTDLSNSVRAGSYHAQDHMRPVKSEKNSLLVKLLAGEYNGGVISCRFSRPINPGATGMRDLTQKWYLLSALGPVAKNKIQLHSWKTASSLKVNVSAPVSVSSTTDNLD